jgi:hypothetical protein
VYHDDSGKDRSNLAAAIEPRVWARGLYVGTAGEVVIPDRLFRPLPPRVLGHITWLLAIAGKGPPA